MDAASVETSTPVVWVGDFDATQKPFDADQLLRQVGMMLATGGPSAYDWACGVIDAELESRLNQGHEKAQAAFRPLMGRRNPLEMEILASQVLLTRLPDGRSLRDIRRPIHGNTVDYYGITFELSGLPEGSYFVSELELGILAVVKGATGRVDNVAIVHPDRINYQDSRVTHARATLVDPRDLDAAILGGRRIPGFAEDADAFFAGFHDFFDEQPWYEKKSGIPGLVDLVPTQSELNFNVYSFEEKYYLWKMLSSCRDDELDAISAFLSFVDQAGPAGKQMIAALDGDEKLVIAAGERLIGLNALYYEGGEAVQQQIEQARKTFNALAYCIADSERFAVERAWAMLPDRERGRYQEKVNFLLPLFHAMAREAIESFAKDRPPGELAEVLEYHRAGFEALQEMVGYVFAAYHPQVKAPEATFFPKELDAIRAGSRLAPEAAITHDMLIRHAYAKGMYVQRNVSIKDRQAWLKAFYERVIAMGVYEADVAKEYKDVSGLEEMRLANALVTLGERDLIPPKANVLSVGCGNGTVETKVIELLEKSHPDGILGHITGLDPVFQGKGTIWAEKFTGKVSIDFLHTALEDALTRLPDLEGSFDLIVLNGSPLNNMDLLVMQKEYFKALNRLLKPGGIVMIETGLAEPAREVNERWQAIEAYARLAPSKPLGTIGIKPIYRSEGDRPEDPGAFLYLTTTFEAIEKMSGLKMLSPRSIEELIHAGDDPRGLIQKSINQPNAFLQPVYVTNPDGQWGGETLLSFRGAIFLQREGEPVVDDPFLSPLEAVVKG